MATCDWICIGEWIFLILWLISVPTYCMVIFTIVKKRKTKFKEEFWLLAIALFVADLLHLCQYMWGLKLPSWGYVPSVFMRVRHITGWLMLVPQSAFLCAEFMGVVFLSLNRYVALMKPLQYQLIWTRKKTLCCIGAQCCVACFVFLWCAPIRYTVVQNTYNNETSFSALLDPRDNKIVGIFFGIVFGIGGWVRIALFAFLYGRMFYHVYKENRKVTLAANNQRSTFNKAEFNLVIMGGLLALCDTAITFHAFDLAILMSAAGVETIGPETIRYWAFRSACVTDVFGWMNGWLLLACCQQVRIEFRKQFGCKTVNKVHVRTTKVTAKKISTAQATSRV